jgi:hypothetical protein
MRRSFDGLALAAKQELGQDPRSGTLFVFLIDLPTGQRIRNLRREAKFDLSMG